MRGATWESSLCTKSSMPFWFAERLNLPMRSILTTFLIAIAGY